ncbi:MAG: condensation domain-containing protein [Eubacteriales bacterium]
MPKPDSKTIYYDLSSSQKIAAMLLKFCFFKESINIAVCLYVKQQLDLDLLQKAFNIEIERNDCLRIFYKKKHGNIVQYFSEPYEAAITCVDFSDKTKEDQDAFLSKEAKKPIRFLQGEIYRIKHIKTYDKRSGLFFTVCHLNMDAMSVFLFFNDLIKVYMALLNKTEMPKPFMPFTEYMEREKNYLNNAEKIAKDEQFFRDLYKTGGEPLYCGVDGIKPLEDLRKKRRNPNLRSFPTVNPLQDKTKNIKLHISAECSKQIDKYCADNNTTPFCLIQLAMRLYLSKVNNGVEDILYCAICNRRATVADKNTNGSFADGVNIRTVIGADMKFCDAVTSTGDALSQSLRHANYSSIKSNMLLTDMYKKSLLDSYISMVVSYIPILSPDGWEYEAEWISNGRFAMHMYVIIVQKPSDGSYDIYYEYRVKILKQEHIEAFHNGMLEILKSGINNPDMTVGEMIKQTTPVAVAPDIILQ